MPLSLPVWDRLVLCELNVMDRQPTATPTRRTREKEGTEESTSNENRGKEEAYQKSTVDSQHPMPKER